MNSNLLLALIPFFGWALGDFFIQKTTRKIGDARTLLYLCIFSTIVFLPFIDFSNIFQNHNLYFLIFTGVFGFIYAMTIFQAFKVAKLSVIEAVVAIELPLTIFLAVSFLGEGVAFKEIIIIGIMFVAMLFTVTKENPLKVHGHILEKGFYLALAAVALSAVFNFLVGVSGIENNPIFAVWVIHIIIGICAFVFVGFSGELGEIYHDLKTHPYLIMFASFFDTVAWGGYAYAVSKNDISSVVAVSEGYIALAAFLGFYFNKEKLARHQIFGMLIVFVCVFVLILNLGK